MSLTPRELKYNVKHSNLHIDSKYAPQKSKLTNNGKFWMQNNYTKYDI